jgi:hypothetical protein
MRNIILGLPPGLVGRVGSLVGVFAEQHDENSDSI